MVMPRKNPGTGNSEKNSKPKDKLAGVHVNSGSKVQHTYGPSSMAPGGKSTQNPAAAAAKYGGIVGGMGKPSGAKNIPNPKPMPFTEKPTATKRAVRKFEKPSIGTARGRR